MTKRILHIVLPVLLIAISSLFSIAVQAQGGVKIGQNPTTINPNAVVEIESTNKGLLLPRVALSSLTNPAPLSAFVKGMVVFNTASTDSILPGLYFSEGTKWVKVNQISAPSGGGTGTTSWNLSGNGFTTPADFLGTTDSADLTIKTNNTERIHINADGSIGIGTAIPTATLDVKGDVVIRTLEAGNRATDSLLVANPANGRVKAISSSNFVTGVQKRLEVVATSGQTVFVTPVTITDLGKIMMYRNGIQISFALNTANSIIAEVACTAGDEIRIIQFL
ncbi:MAG: hypothetical protein WCI49_06975 [Ferruginibacter sp.]